MLLVYADVPIGVQVPTMRVRKIRGKLHLRHWKLSHRSPPSRRFPRKEKEGGHAEGKRNRSRGGQRPSKAVT